jgi:hypothetical protein
MTRRKPEELISVVLQGESNQVKVIFSVTKTKAGKISRVGKHWRIYSREQGENWVGGLPQSNYDYWNIRGLLEKSSDPLHQEILSKFRI